MDRRDFNRRLASLAAGVGLWPAGAVPFDRAEAAAPLPQEDMMAAMRRFVDDLAQGDQAIKDQIVPAKWRQVGLVAFPGMFPLDILGPKTIFEDLLNTHVHIVAKTKAPIAVGGHAQLLPDHTLADCPDQLDVLFVPGGGLGPVTMMQDGEMLEFLRHQAATARYVTSVCTGSLVLGAAGLLRGYRATSHWVTLDVLSRLGATPVKARVVEDRNRITGAGVTAGLDLAFVIAARLTGERYARAEMLNVEYDPDPPFRAGSPAEAGEPVTGALTRMYGGLTRAFEAAATEAAKRFG
ncbi:MAG: DJ-1/PfpI family protein [Gemmatimonadales bacterium]